MTRALSRIKPALPYICLLIVFSRLTCPSTGPLLHFVVIAASTADSSRRIPSTNRRSSEVGDASPLASQSLKVPRDCLRISFANSSAISNAAASSSLPARIASSRSCSSGLRFSSRRTHSKDNCFADGRGTDGALAALIRSRFFPATASRFVTYRCRLPYEPLKPIAVNCLCKSTAFALPSARRASIHSRCASNRDRRARPGFQSGLVSHRR